MFVIPANLDNRSDRRVPFYIDMHHRFSFNFIIKKKIIFFYKTLDTY